MIWHRRNCLQTNHQICHFRNLLLILFFHYELCSDGELEVRLISFGSGALVLAVIAGFVAYCRRRVQDLLARRLGGGRSAPNPSADGTRAVFPAPGSTPPERNSANSIAAAANVAPNAEPDADGSALSSIVLPPPPTPPPIFIREEPLALGETRDSRPEIIEPPEAALTPGLVPALPASSTRLCLPAPTPRLALSAPARAPVTEGGVGKPTVEDIVQGEGEKGYSVTLSF